MANVKLVRNMENIAMKGGDLAPPPRKPARSPRQMREDALARRRQQRQKEIDEENQVCHARCIGNVSPLSCLCPGPSCVASLRSVCL